MCHLGIPYPIFLLQEKWQEIQYKLCCPNNAEILFKQRTRLYIRWIKFRNKKRPMEEESASNRRKALQAQIQRCKKELRSSSCSKARRKELSSLVANLESEKTSMSLTPDDIAPGTPILKKDESIAALRKSSRLISVDIESPRPDVSFGASLEEEIDEAVVVSPVTFGGPKKKAKKMTKWQKQDLEVEKMRQETLDQIDEGEQEWKLLKEQLEENHLTVVAIPPDGHWYYPINSGIRLYLLLNFCSLFCAISHQLLIVHQVVIFLLNAWRTH
jgi:hypothetical protein